MKLLGQILYFLTLGSWRKRRREAMRRERYEFLKSKISERHFGGYAGLIVDFPGRKFDLVDLGCFKAPMYYIVKNADMKWCIFWDRKRLTSEIGAGAPLKEGEVLVPESSAGRSKPSSTVETIDETAPLTQKVSGGSAGNA